MSESLTPAAGNVDFSVVISCFCEQESIGDFHGRLSKTLESLGRSCEIIYINDGSTDRTLEKLLEIFHRDPGVAAVVDMYKNSGQANAKTPGIMLARGKALVFIDSDLQLDPEELPALIREYDQGYDIVSGYRAVRQDPLLRKIPSAMANFIMRRASKSTIRDFGCTFKIYDTRLVRAFDFGPFRPWRSVPVISMARRIKELPVTHHPRKYGKSGWTFGKLLSYNMENFVNLSEVPFQVVGGICMLFAFLFLVRVLVARLYRFSILPKVTTGLLLNAIVISLLIVVAILCAIGEFSIRNFIMMQKKPAFIVRKVYRRESPAPCGSGGS